MHLQSLNANSPDETGKGSSRVTSNEQVHMYREMSSGALNRATYNKVRIRVQRCCIMVSFALQYKEYEIFSIVLDGTNTK